MIVGHPSTQVGAPTGATPATREASPQDSVEATSAAVVFLGLLNLATTPPAAAVTALVAASGQAEEDARTEDVPVDWVMPFLTPSPATPPMPLDLELPASDAGGGSLPLAGTTPPLNGPITPLPVLVDDSGPVKELTLIDVPKTPSAIDATGSAAIPAAPRVEVTANGGTHVVVRHVTVPVADPRWSEHVGHEVRILVERGIQGATLRLTPEHLGPVDVRIDIVNDKANVVFGAAQADTRAALTEAIPKLREMFAGAGLALGDAGVRQEAPGHFTGEGPRAPRHDAFGALPGDESTALASTVRVGLVDAYA